jgi:hypothetical protein
MGFFKNLFAPKKADTPAAMLEQIKAIQVNDLARIIQQLETADDTSFTLARDTFLAFQRGFASKFKTTKNFVASPDEVRHEYMATFSNVLTRFNNLDMTDQALGASLFTIVMYAVEMEDYTFHDEIDQKLIKLFNNR